MIFSKHCQIIAKVMLRLVSPCHSLVTDCGVTDSKVRDLRSVAESCIVLRVIVLVAAVRVGSRKQVAPHK
jgi:hypothetical protein